PAAASQAGITELDDLLGTPGFTPAVLDRLRAFAVVLPQRTPINVNTAPPIVLMSVADLAPADAQRLVASRQQANFRDTSDFVLRLNDRQTLEGVNFAVSSDFFLVTSKVQVHTASLTTQALLWLRSRNPTKTALVSLRER
ncbi:MAG TPA: type II secretion system protein GspK, partial [Telluria sp.]|nr:type II secretion system protein GspK [Telluria sp.]